MDVDAANHGVSVASLRWHPSTHQRRLFTLLAMAFVAATAAGRPVLIVLAVPPLWLLLKPNLSRLSRAQGQLTAESAVTRDRCLEGEEFEVRVRVENGLALDQLDLEFVPGETTELCSGSAVVSFVGVGPVVEATWRVRATRWGRRDVGTLRLSAHSAGRLRVGFGELMLAEVSVFPHHAPLSALRIRYSLPDRIGDNTSKVAGDGVEFIDVGDYRLGDRPRRINWRATARRGSLQANRTAAERACDVVVVLDAFSDVGGVERSSLDVAVRGAVATAQAYLKQHDRVGLVVLGGELVWLRPDLGGRQFYRVVERVLDARRAHAADRPALAGAPRAALPPGALAFVFTPLLDPRVFDALTALRERGTTPVVIDVRTCDPVLESDIVNADLALRLWRVEHAAGVRGLLRSGLPVVAWDGSEGLDVAFSRLPHRVRSA